MLEKLIEDWLDSATERSYQPIFCQMLLNEGYTVIHSTRHMPIEFGKDVIAIAPDRSIHAFQLKGNPNSRLTLSQYRDILPQLKELTSHSISVQENVSGNHKSYLVTNGEIDEEVRLAIEKENSANDRDGISNRNLFTMSRGNLLGWAKKLDVGLWPSELENTRLLLEILTDGGDDIFPIEKFHNLMQSLLKINEDDISIPKTEINRRANSAALLTAICLTPFSRKKNHWAVITAWTIFSTYLIGRSEKGGVSNLSMRLDFFENLIFTEMSLLLTEVTNRPNNLTEGNILPDFAIYSWRKILLLGVGSIFWLWVEKNQAWDRIEFKNKLEDFLNNEINVSKFWGEAALPQLLLHIWAKEKKDMQQYVSAIEKLTEIAINEPLPNIYHDAEKVIRHNLSVFLDYIQSPIEGEIDNTVSESTIAEILMLHLAYRDEKEICKSLWKNYSHIGLKSFHPSKKYEYCLYKSNRGKNITSLPRELEQWNELKMSAIPIADNFVPAALLSRQWLLCLWLIICPQRCIPEVINHLYKNFAK